MYVLVVDLFLPVTNPNLLQGGGRVPLVPSLHPRHVEQCLEHSRDSVHVHQINGNRKLI